jgi:hypothetical protein
MNTVIEPLCIFFAQKSNYSWVRFAGRGMLDFFGAFLSLMLGMK